MQRPSPRAFLSLLASLAANGAAAQPVADPYGLCRPAIEQASAEAAIPAGLMLGIARIESGRRDPASGRVEPWPWAINAAGEGRYLGSAGEAIQTVQGYLAAGVRSVDVGCMQISLLHHPLAFASLAEAFDPLTNARYAARFLRQLQAQYGWEGATGRYHSADPERAEPYRARVAAAMAGLPIPGGGGGGGGLGATLPGPVTRRDWYTVVVSPSAALVRIETPRGRRAAPPAARALPLAPAPPAAPALNVAPSPLAMARPRGAGPAASGGLPVIISGRQR